jgi:hypothetical protein
MDFATDDALESRKPKRIPLSIEQQFIKFCAEHADVLVLFERFARELKAAGHARGSSKMIWERLRWERLTSAHGAESPALNNVFTSRISRWLMERDPSFCGFFEVRELKAR